MRAKELLQTKRFKAILIIIIIGVIALLSFCLWGRMTINSVEININYPNEQVILSKNNIQQMLVNHFGDFTHYSRNKIDRQQIKDYLLTNNFVDMVVINISITGQMYITIYQKEIIARVYSNDSKSYYLSIDKQIIDKTKCIEIVNVPIIIGDIIIANNNNYIDTLHENILYNMYKLSVMIAHDKVLKDKISMIIEQKNIYKLLPSQGQYEINLSTVNAWQEEITKLSALMQYCFSVSGWDNYKSIDLSYHNQVVCSKKDKKIVVDTLSVTKSDQSDSVLESRTKLVN